MTQVHKHAPPQTEPLPRCTVMVICEETGCSRGEIASVDINESNFVTVLTRARRQHAKDVHHWGGEV